MTENSEEELYEPDRSRFIKPVVKERGTTLLWNFEGALLPNLIGGKKVQASSVDGKCCRLQSV